MADLTALELAVLLPGIGVVLAVSGHLGLIDWREHRLPDRLTRPLTIFVTVWLLLLGLVAGDLIRGVQAIGWGVAAFVAFLILSFAGMGGGDVKFAAPLGATLGWFGWSSVSAGLFGLAMSAGVVGVIVMIQRKGGNHRVAYGPYMVIGLLCGLARALFV